MSFRTSTRTLRSVRCGLVAVAATALLVSVAAAATASSVDPGEVVYRDSFGDGDLEEYTARTGPGDRWSVDDHFDGAALHARSEDRGTQTQLFLDPAEHRWSPPLRIEVDFQADAGYWSKQARVLFGDPNGSYWEVKVGVEGEGIVIRNTGAGAFEKVEDEFRIRDAAKHHLTVHVGEERIRAVLDGDHTLTYDHGAPIEAGTVGFALGATGETWYDNLVIRSPAGSDGLDVPTRFEEDFDDGRVDGWSQVWWDTQGCVNRAPDDDHSDDWQVRPETGLGGDPALKHNSRCASTNSGDTLATDDPVVRPSEPFQVSFDFFFEDPEHRGPRLFLVNASSNGEPNGERVAREHLVEFFRLHNPTASKQISRDQAVEIFGVRKAIGTNARPVTHGEAHTARLVRANGSFTAYLDGERLASVDASEVRSRVRLDQSFRLALAGSGNWGSPSTIWYDDIHLHQAPADSSRWSYEDGLGDWTTGLHPCKAGPDDGVTLGAAGWSDRHGGSVRLHADGGPGGAGTWIPLEDLGDLGAGDVVHANYTSPDFDGAPGNLNLVLYPPAPCEGNRERDRIRLARDEGRPDKPQYTNDGVLVGTVPRDVPGNWSLAVHAQGWPADFEVFVQDVSVSGIHEEAPETGRDPGLVSLLEAKNETIVELRARIQALRGEVDAQEALLEEENQRLEVLESQVDDADGGSHADPGADGTVTQRARTSSTGSSGAGGDRRPPSAGADDRSIPSISAATTLAAVAALGAASTGGGRRP